MRICKGIRMRKAIPQITPNLAIIGVLHNRFRICLTQFTELTFF